MIRTLLLDLDGTLVHSVPDLAAALNRLLAARGLAGLSHAETAAMVGDGVARLVERAFAARGRVADSDTVAEFSADYGAHSAVETAPYPGVAEALRSLAGEGWRLAVCTNKPEQAARTLLAAVGLAPLFAAIGGGDSFADPQARPSPSVGNTGSRRRGEDACGDGGRPRQRCHCGTRGRPAMHIRRLGIRAYGNGGGCGRGGAGLYRIGGDRPGAGGVGSGVGFCCPLAINCRQCAPAPLPVLRCISTAATTASSSAQPMTKNVSL